MFNKLLSNLYKNAFITGGSSGLGKAFCDLLQKEGINVLKTSRHPKNSSFLPLDLNSSLSLKKLINVISNQKNIDLFINNAASSMIAPFEDISDEILEEQIVQLFINQIKLIKFIYQYMLKQGFGTIVNISSMASVYPIPYMQIYNTCKAGLSALINSLMLEKNKIIFIDIKPGDFNTNFKINVHQNLDSINQKLSLKTFQSLQSRMLKYPSPSYGALQLKKILIKQKSGNYYIGNFSQCYLYPLFLRFIPEKLKFKIIKMYYNIH